MNKPDKLLIGFDARMVAYRQAGIGQYSVNLLRELAALTAMQPAFKLIVYQSRKEKRSPSEWLPLPPDQAPVGKRLLWIPPHHRLEQLALPLELLPLGLQVLHSPDFVPPFWRYAWQGWYPRRIASVITIHDLAFIRFPHLLTAESARYYRQVRKAVHNAERIIAVSHNTARDIVDYLQISPAKVRVIYEAASPHYRALSPAELDDLGRQQQRLLDRLKTGGLTPLDSFLLFVSTIEPRKNLPVLLQAYRRLLDEKAGDAPKLVLAGREGWLFEDVRRLVAELKLTPHLIWLGSVETSELLYLYNRAALLAMPSLYEGFGLPPLEALACGCPVVVADTSSLPEVVGTQGRCLPPEDVTAWAAALSDGWRNRVRHKAQALDQGPAWAAGFSWRQAASQTLAVYFEAYNNLRVKV